MAQHRHIGKFICELPNGRTIQKKKPIHQVHKVKKIKKKIKPIKQYGLRFAKMKKTKTIKYSSVLDEIGI